MYKFLSQLSSESVKKVSGATDVVIHHLRMFCGSLLSLLLVWEECRIFCSGTLIGSCMTHFILWALVNTLCCCMTDGILLGLPGCFVACYACGYLRAFREKYNLQEAPCGDFISHFFCHLCANCQEYREIRERASDSIPAGLKLPVVTAPPVQKMESGIAE